MTAPEALAAAEHAAGEWTRQDGTKAYDCADVWPSDHTVEWHMSDVEDTLKHLPPDAHLFTVDSLAAALDRLGRVWDRMLDPDSDMSNAEFATAVIKAAKEASE